jgi:formamidopyrimidine-DNA glycosylase
MPELPEVETITRRLKQVLPSKQILDVDVLANKSLQGSLELLKGKTIKDVVRRAKISSIVFEDNTYLATHLKMTGQLIYVDPQTRLGGGHPTADWVSELPTKHTRIRYQLSDDAELFFNDQRLFGWMKLLTQEEHDQLFSTWGPDIIDDAVTTAFLQEKFSRRSIPIKQAIMDNAILCGVGNIYAADSLNLARISPFRPANSLSEKEIAVLLTAMKETIAKAVDMGGTTFDGSYVSIDGFAGGYQNEVLAYGRQGKPCYNCGTLLEKEKIAGRGTYYCPNCQV